jgi:hypothetical protein
MPTALLGLKREVGHNHTIQAMRPLKVATGLQNELIDLENLFLYSSSIVECCFFVHKFLTICISYNLQKRSATGRATPPDKVFLKCRSLRWLSQSSVLIGTHLHSKALQNLFNAMVSVPVSHGGQFVGFDGTSFGIHTAHVDFGNESDFGWNRGILLGAMNMQLVKSAVVLGLWKTKEISDTNA